MMGRLNHRRSGRMPDTIFVAVFLVGLLLGGFRADAGQMVNPVKLIVNLKCYNPGSSQDVLKTPYIKNTTGKIIKAGSKISWRSSDGDQGSITLTKDLPPNQEVQGSGQAGGTYTCTAWTSKLNLKAVKIRVPQDPWIDGMLPIPSKNLPYPPPGAIQAGSTIYIKGKRFGNKKGRIIMYFGSSPVQLVNLGWTDATRVHGTVPMSVNGRPNRQVTIRVERADGKLSNARTIQFRGREEMVLTRNHVSVTCGTDANANVCNNWSKGTANIFVTGGCPSDEIAICGLHVNNKFAVGDDTGTDHFNITLHNGWTFKSIKRKIWKKSSGDEHIGNLTPPFPKGKSTWGVSIGWVVSPGDFINYGYEITIEGPVGTKPF